MDEKIEPTLTFFGDFLSKLSENSDHVYWLSSPDFQKIQFISPAYERIWGRKREELYLNPSIWINFLHPEDRHRKHPIESMIEKLVRLGDSARLSEQYRIIRPDGEVRWIMDNGFPIYNSEGVCCGVTGVAVDVTEDKQRELELKKAKEDAEAANRAKIEFIENMSHDIRTPLSGVIGMSGLLVNGLHDSQQKQYAQWINESGEQLLKLLNGILEVISADSVNENDLRNEYFDLRRCIKDILELEMPTAYIKGLELRAHVDDNVPQFIYSDRIKIHRILLNLLGNAIKFTEKGHVALSVHLLELNSQKAVIHYSLSDTGIGITSDQQQKVFDRFHKVTPSYKGIYSGFGVGLHIVLAYVKLLRGDIKLTSKLGMGTTFDVFLPVEYLNHDFLRPVADSSSPEQLTDSKWTYTQECHVLLIEDNTIALKVAEAVAKGVGCTITSARNGEEAFAIVKTGQHFDLIITDIGLPGMSGYDLTRSIRIFELKNNKNKTPIIGITAHAKSHAESNCLGAGMDGVYSKPLTIEIMNTLLQKYLSKELLSSKDNIPANGQLGTDLPDTEEALFSLEHLPLLDIDKAVQAIGNRDLVKQVLQLMISDEIKTDIKAIEIAHTNENWSEIERFAHKMKGGAVYIGTVRMHYACMYLERYHKAGHVKLLEPLYQQLLVVVHDTQAHIRLWLKQ